MRSFLRTYHNMKSPVCKYLHRDKDGELYCEKNLDLICYKTGLFNDCSKFELKKDKRLNRRECRKFIHDSQKLAKTMKRYNK